MSSPSIRDKSVPPLLFAVGGAHIDRRGRMTVDFVPGASIPGTMAEEVGGGAFNALRTAVQRGVSGALMSVRGADSAGDTVARAIASAGIADLSVVFLDRTTPSYTALVDRHGEVLTGLADMALYEIALPKQMRRSKVREAIAAADAVFCDANLPHTALAALTALATAGSKPVFGIAISPAKAARLAGLLDRFAVLFMNTREAATLAGMDSGQASDDRMVENNGSHGGDPKHLVAGLRAAGLRAGVITSGGAPVIGFDDQSVFAIKPPAPRHVADATGAGDALAGATAAAMMRGAPFRSALREGIAAAVLTIESPSAVAKMPNDIFGGMLAMVPEAILL